MAVTPHALFEAARGLEQGGSEVDLRNAASRAYYAAYHQCLRLDPAPAAQSPPNHRGVHRMVIDALTSAGDAKLKSLGYMLEQCRKLRVKADYHIESEFPSSDARTALAQCARILNGTNSILPVSGGSP